LGDEMDMAPIVSRRWMLIETMDTYVFWMCVVALVVVFFVPFIDRKKRPNLRLCGDMVTGLFGIALMLYIVWRTWMFLHIYDP